MATPYNAAGSPVGTIRCSIDFQHPGRYELALKDQSPEAHGDGRWCNSKVLGVDGLVPCWADDEAGLFISERLNAPRDIRHPIERAGPW